MSTDVDTLPLSAAQEAIWLGQHLAPTSPVYNTADYVVIDGEIDPGRFEAAVRTAVAEADCLHARFHLVGGEPRQSFEPGRWRFLLVDLSAEAAPEAAAERWMHGDVRTPADLRTGPLFAQALLKLSDDRWIWHQRIHHIAVDGYAFALLVRRVADLYSTDGGGRPFDPFQRVLDFERSYLDSARCAADGEFWGEYLSGVAEPPWLGHGRTDGIADRTERAVVPVPAQRIERWQELATAVGVNWTELLIASVAGYVHRVTGVGDVLLGLPVSARLATPLLHVPAPVSNIVPLRLPVDPAASLSSLAMSAAAELKRTRRHHRYRQEHLRRDRRRADGPERLFGPVVNVLPFDQEFTFGPHRGRMVNLSAGPVEDLSVGFRGSAAGLRLEMDGNPAGHSASGLRRHSDLLLRLVDEAVREPDRPLARIPLADRPVRRPSPARRPAPDVVALIRARAADRPGATAIEQDRHRLTYAALLARADLLADGLRRRGAGPGHLVGVRLPRTPDAIVAVLAVLISGAGYVPLSPDAPDAYGGHLPRITVEDGLLLSGHTGDEPPPARSARGTDIAYVIHTSGSTGRPNGVMVPRAALAGFAGAAVERYGVDENDRVLQFSSLQFDASVEEIFVALCSGAALVLRTDGMNESLDEFRRATARFGITVLDLPTAFWHELVAAGGRLPGSVHTVIIGGEGALPSRVAQWARLAPGVRLINTYGPTEATVVATAADLHPAGSGRP